LDETPKQLAERRLREMVSKACDVVEQSIKSPVVVRGQQTRSNDAWRTIMAVLEMPEAKQAALDVGPFASEPVADVSEKLRLIKQAERRAR
jgi:hypothetical protein